jgi:hypothetical protein
VVFPVLFQEAVILPAQLCILTITNPIKVPAQIPTNVFVENTRVSVRM